MKVAAVGAGKIVNMWLSAIKDMEEVICTAVYVRAASIKKGEMLAAKYSIEKVYTDFQEMLNIEEIDFIYIGVSNDAHFSFAKQALCNNKNVILEKPFTTTVAEAQELVQIAQERKLFLFEAIKNLYSPLLAKMQEALPKIGEIKMVQSNFSQISSRYKEYQAGKIHPIFDYQMHGGALYDLNVYNLHLMVHLFGEPSENHYYANKGKGGADMSGIINMRYPHFVASAAAAKDAAGEGYFLIQGDQGYIKAIGEPCLLPKLEISTEEGQETYLDEGSKTSMKYEFAWFWEIWQDGNYRACIKKMEQTIKVMKILDYLWQEI